MSISAAVTGLKLNLFTDVSNDMCITNVIDYEAINTYNANKIVLIYFVVNSYYSSLSYFTDMLTYNVVHVIFKGNSLQSHSGIMHQSAMS